MFDKKVDGLKGGHLVRNLNFRPGPYCNASRKNGPRKIGPRETRKQKIVG